MFHFHSAEINQHTVVFIGNSCIPYLFKMAGDTSVQSDRSTKKTKKCAHNAGKVLRTN